MSSVQPTDEVGKGRLTKKFNILIDLKEKER